MRRILPTLCAGAGLALLLPAPAASQDDCPAPRVLVRTLAAGQPVRPFGVFPGSQDATTLTLAGVHDWALNRVIGANAGEVRFFEQAGPSPPDADFVLTADGRRLADTRFRSTLTLTDNRGRTVGAPGSVEYTADEAGRAEPLADALAGGLDPMLPVIREHQRRIREEEGSAIYAFLRIEPGNETIDVDEELTLRLELVDCDEGNPPLPERSVELILEGPGELDRAAVTTDGEGRGEVVFSSEHGGTAEVFPRWEYVNTSGDPINADANFATVRIGVMAFERVAVVSRFEEDGRHYLGQMEVTANDYQFVDFPAEGVRSASRGGSRWCERLEQYHGGEEVPLGGHRRWAPRLTDGSQHADALIEAAWDSAGSARVRISVSTGGEPESHWEEEEGSALFALVVPLFVFEVDNPARGTYDLRVTPLRIEGRASGDADFTLSLRVEGEGCAGGHSPPGSAWRRYGHYESEQEGNRLSGSPDPLEIRVDGDPYVQFLVTAQAIAHAWAGVLEGPTSGQATVEIELRLDLVPVEQEEGGAG